MSQEGGRRDQLGMNRENGENTEFWQLLVKKEGEKNFVIIASLI